jgi:alpha-tubulin suppressor-like RCC1 family protein
VVAVGYNDYGQCNVTGWTDIVHVAAGYGHTVGVKADGTVVAVGLNDDGQCDTDDWTDILQAAAGSYHTAGLRADGTVVATGLEVGLAKWNLGNAALYLITSSTGGGEVTRPGKGTLSYYPGRVINLVARPADGYRFVNWTGDVDTVANTNAPQTTITMDNNCAIVANFEENPPINWALIGGIIGAVVVAGLVIFLVRKKRRAAETKRH